MGKASKTKKNKVPVIGDKEYAEYINFLKTASDGEVKQGDLDLRSIGENSLKECEFKNT